MQDNVKEKAVLISDAYKSYNGLEKLYDHVTVKHTENNYVTDRHFHTNNIENFWSIFKRGIIGIYHQVSAKHLHRYTTEFGYRYNNRQDTGVIKFHDAVGKSANSTLSYQKLIGGVSKQTIDTVSTKFEEKSPEQDFLDRLDNIDTGNSPISE